MDEATGCITGDWMSGRGQIGLTRVLAPKPEETREMLLALREKFHFSRGELAALLASSEAALKAWECNRRSPSLIARRLIWMTDFFIRHRQVLTFVDLITWGATRHEGTLSENDYQI